MNSKLAARLGIVLSALCVLFLVMDGGMKAAGAQVAIDATAQLGFAASTTRVLGVILLVATLLYAVPTTAVLGAVLVTGYLGGAIASQLHQGSPLGSHVLFGVYVGWVLWSGLWLRSAPLRAVLPLATDSINSVRPPAEDVAALE